ncbi:hypothetical protein [Deinococcus hopiensis]|nr:hypothetical protein [Deinococcus hopiensis]
MDASTVMMTITNGCAANGARVHAFRVKGEGGVGVVPSWNAGVQRLLLDLGGGNTAVEGTTVSPRSPVAHTRNQRAFETCITLILQVAVEFAPAGGEERPSRAVLLSFAGEVERNAREIAAVSGGGDLAASELGREWYVKLAAARDGPVQVAYHALHSAAYLGLERGELAATMLAAVAYALRVLAAQPGAANEREFSVTAFLYGHRSAQALTSC